MKQSGIRVRSPFDRAAVRHEAKCRRRTEKRPGRLADDVVGPIARRAANAAEVVDAAAIRVLLALVRVFQGQPTEAVLLGRERVRRHRSGVKFALGAVREAVIEPEQTVPDAPMAVVDRPVQVAWMSRARAVGAADTAGPV